MTGKSTTQRGGYNREVEWYLTEVARLMGERSNFGGLVAVIERGGTGGCKGTKGCGIVRIEPFENGPELVLLHRDFGRARRCEATWEALSTYHRWLLAARYCYSREKLPPGLHGQLGDLSVVAMVAAASVDEAHRHEDGHKCQVARLLDGAPKKGGNKWAENLAARELEHAHTMWGLLRAQAAIGGAV